MPNIPVVVSDTFSLQNTANTILPHESVDDGVRRYVISVCSEGLLQTSDYRTWVEEATKRYEAMRSTRSLDRDDPGTPWPRSSNVGLPLEAIAGEALVPRFNAATTDATPIYRVKLPGSDPMLKQYEETATQWFQDVQIKAMRVRKVRDETYRNMVIDGDGIEGLTWETTYQQTAKTVALLVNATGEFLIDETTGQPRLFPANLMPDGIPDDPLVPGRKLKKILTQQKGSRPLYDGPRVRTWRLRECIWPADATTPNINELDWFAVQMWKSPSWFKTREGDPIEGGLKNVDDLLLRLRHGIPSHLDTDAERGLWHGLSFPSHRHKALLWQFHGKFDVDRDGIDEEIIALVAPRERLLLGWRLASTAERPFFHYQLFKMPGRFTGRGLPHLAKGMRDIVDFKINQSNNREALYGNPPVLYEATSGFDPNLHQFGVGQKWGPLADGGISRIKALELPKAQESLAIEFIQFYVGMLSRVTGINDFNLGTPQPGAPSSVKTASGQAMLTQEGNIKFTDFIKDIQDTSEQEMEFLDREWLQAGLVTAENAPRLSTVDVPLEILRLPKRLYSTGNSQTMSRQVLQEIALVMFDRFAQDQLLMLDPAIQRQLRQAVFDAFDSGIQLPTIQEMAQMDQDRQILMESMAQPAGAPQPGQPEAAHAGPVAV